MKRIILSSTFVLVLSVAGIAQVTPDHGHRRDGTIAIISGAGGPGMIWSTGHGSFTYSSYGGFSPWAWWSRPRASGLGTTVPWWWRRPVYGPHAGGGYVYSRPFRPMDTSPPVSAVTPKMRGVSDRQHELVASRHVTKGIRRFKAGDYAAARDAFREAVVEDGGPQAEALFALALAATGDAANGEKALRSAATRAPFGKLDLDQLFRDKKEQKRVVAKFTGLVADWSRALAGNDADLRKRSEKDKAAKALLK